ncbi:MULTISPECIES: cysteine peptidase family C39 domain-containing protein [Carnobacterium]|uniref:cysteine peptidase family C39 domain-containing protein n=1 Tax=Carnobacterium TaxID=2747 RepID=UPI0035D55DB3
MISLTIKDRIKIKKFVGIKQHEKRDCGAACLATIAKFHGIFMELRFLSLLLGITSRLIKWEQVYMALFKVLQD